MIGERAGATVRDRDGAAGKFLRWQLPEVAIGWEDEGQILPREETLDRANPRLRDQIEVMTLDAGWVPLGNFMSEDGVPTPGHSTVTQLRKLMAEADEMPLAEAGKAHYPFKRKSHLGPGPRSGENDKANHWDCKCKNYNCTCKGTGPFKGRTRSVFIDPGYKAAYNKEYKAWRAKKNKAKG